MIAGFLTTVAAGLAAYPLASAVLTKTRDGNPGALLSPFHYYLMLDLIENAGYFTVWRWLKFRFSKSQKQTKPPPQLINLGRTACLTLIFGALIFIGETWLHFKTDPTEFTQFGPLRSDTATYSMSLNSNCTTQDNTFNQQWNRPCSFSPSIRGGYFLNPSTTLEVFNNISTTRSVNVVYGTDATHAFLGIPNNGRDQGHDFTATTFSVSTQCQSATADCNVSRDNITSGAGSWFHCAKHTAWWGLVNGPRLDFSKHYFTDATGTQNATSVDDTISNPFYIGFGGFTDPSAGAGLKLIQYNDLGVIAQEFGGVGYLFFCNTTVYDVTYTAVNGSITDFMTTPSNSSTSTALVAADSNLNSGDIKLRDAADLGAILANDTQDMADIFALEYSRILLSTVSGALQASPILGGRQRTTKIVARVPTVPLYFLLASVALMIGLGIWLTVAALITIRIKDIEEVRARLSVKQLVADRMEPEAARAPIKRPSGGLFIDGSSTHIDSPITTQSSRTGATTTTPTTHRIPTTTPKTSPKATSTTTHTTSTKPATTSIKPTTTRTKPTTISTKPTTTPTTPTPKPSHTDEILTIGTLTITADPTGFQIGSTTLTPGGFITVGTETISLETGGGDVIIGGTTVPITTATSTQDWTTLSDESTTGLYGLITLPGLKTLTTPTIITTQYIVSSMKTTTGPIYVGTGGIALQSWPPSTDNDHSGGGIIIPDPIRPSISNPKLKCPAILKWLCGPENTSSTDNGSDVDPADKPNSDPEDDPNKDDNPTTGPTSTHSSTTSTSTTSTSTCTKTQTVTDCEVTCSPTVLSGKSTTTITCFTTSCTTADACSSTGTTATTIITSEPCGTGTAASACPTFTDRTEWVYPHTTIDTGEVDKLAASIMSEDDSILAAFSSAFSQTGASTTPSTLATTTSSGIATRTTSHTATSTRMTSTKATKTSTTTSALTCINQYDSQTDQDSCYCEGHSGVYAIMSSTSGMTNYQPCAWTYIAAAIHRCQCRPYHQHHIRWRRCLLHIGPLGRGWGKQQVLPWYHANHLHCVPYNHLIDLNDFIRGLPNRNRKADGRDVHRHRRLEWLRLDLGRLYSHRGHYP
ncbi:uncharacterized protein N7482_000672 [Penicillium canariense]|uniref:Uncharacterized protein n=1 Tax=Penicillium canariense TaxID=189055 RepID=A0A9W9ICF7_9EURO|nr:uncharacterized protein N7482_000672 [Penicillium canariense]KAJ5174795.1 hypothetical protein N7482_000672 [Penicillium canariense]